MSNTHEKILNAAKELFSTKGYAATTTKDIANRAGVSEVTLFRHFENKRNLFHTALHSTFEADMLINFFENEIVYDLDKDLQKLAQHFYDLYKANGQLIKMMVKDKENSINELTKPKTEKKVKKCSEEYFKKMHQMGKISDDAMMCQKFFHHNAIGYLMRRFVWERCEDGDDYYKWMIDKTINAIKSEHS